jgi:hypothetical protein
MDEGRPIVFGARYSVHVWIVRLLWRKKAFPIDLYRSFAADGPRPEYRVEPMAVSAVRENVAG